MCNEPYRPLWPPDVEAELQTLCLGQVDTPMPSLLNSWVSEWLAVFPNSKRQFLIDKVLPDFRDKHRWDQSRKVFLLCRPSFCTTKDWQLVFICSFWTLGVSNFIDKGSPEYKPDCICKNSRLSLSPFFLKSWWLLLLLHAKNIFCGIS